MMTSLELSNLRDKIRGLPIDCDERKYAAIILIITDVENVSLIHLSDEERNSLAKELYNLNESIEKTMKRAHFVKRAQQYGRIGFNLWLSEYEEPKKIYTCECGKKLETSQKYLHEDGECPIHKPASIETVKMLVEQSHLLDGGTK